MKSLRSAFYAAKLYAKLYTKLEELQSGSFTRFALFLQAGACAQKALVKPSKQSLRR